ncbi:MAG: alpha/beta hydrolase [Acidobacteriota bacterium]|nr:alpha/beta hydrolase [Acidobacteriota bacterium]
MFFSLVSLQQVYGQNNTNGFAEVGGGKIYYETAGRGEKTIVFVHGGLVDSRLWDEQFNEFAKKYRVVRYDLRGYGRSQPLPEKAFSPIEDLSQLLKHLKIEKATIVGLSLGGIISTDFTLEHPEMVERLVLVGAALRGFESKPSEAIIKIYREAAQTTPQKAAELWMKNELFAALEDKPQARARILQMLAGNYRAWMTISDDKYEFPKVVSIERLDKISVPTLVVVGAIDHPDLLAVGKTLDEKIPKSELVIMKNASHHPNLEKPKEFNRILRKFLKHNLRKN